MTTHDDQLFQLLSEFETWQNGHALNERRFVQHDLVLAHLARLYGSLSSHSQHFGLLPSYSLTIEIQEQKPLTLSNLLALTATGKLLVCASVPIPECDNPSENKGLFAIAKPLKLPETLQKTWPVFPLYQVQLEWQAWQTGIDEIVKTGEGIPLGRLKEGQWDEDYIPPMMSLVTDERLRQQATDLINRVKRLACHDNRMPLSVLALPQMDLAQLTPGEFWQAHCRCLIALKTHPKVMANAQSQAVISKIVLDTFYPWQIIENLKALHSVWKQVEQALNQEEKAVSKPRGYVSWNWYANSMLGMMLLAGFLGLNLVYQHEKLLNELKAGFEKQLAALDKKQAETVEGLSKQFVELDNKLVQKTGELSEQLTKVDNQIDWLIPGKVVRDRLKDGSYGPEMVVIPAGTFRMGDIQGGGNSHEKPVHEVSIKSFAMGRYQVTFAEYDKFAEATGREKPKDEGWGRGNRPVINVSWLEVTAYAEWLSTQTGQQYRLPTEAQWEYAARAGTSTQYWWGNELGSNKASCSKCGDGFEYTAPVGSFAANAFGLYDTVGNVWEWTCSEYENAYKGKEKHCLSKEESTQNSLVVLRGGSWGGGAESVHSAIRLGRVGKRNLGVGARLAIYP